MKYLLIMQVNPEILDALSEDERKLIMDGHGEFMKTVQDSGNSSSPRRSPTRRTRPSSPAPAARLPSPTVRSSRPRSTWAVST